ncbi:uncharacterized protein LOC135395002 [Ornithodoros turicata]|uniref:uncharacterized protein LOC135395002 n=1 Tax=Ornithodoros turicata TaxID=34597 RepID=UPI003138E9BD
MANGLVERFHRQLKSAIRAYPAGESWTDSLPLALLGIRTAIKKDMGCTVSEMVYGTSFRLPSDFFPSSPYPPPDYTTYVNRLRSAMHSLHPPPSRNSQPRSIYVPAALATASHVFIRKDSVRGPFQPPHEGQYPVLARSEHHITVQLPRRQDVVAKARLKPAFLHQTETPLPVPPSGPPLLPLKRPRRVHWALPLLRVEGSCGAAENNRSIRTTRACSHAFSGACTTSITLRLR